MSDPIKAALDAAEREPTTAGKIAAFLRALPGRSHDLTWPALQNLATFVEQTARHE